MTQIVLCGPFKLNDANALTGQIIAGVAQPVTTIGFAEALARHLRQATESRMEIASAAVIVHSSSFLDGHPKFPPKKKEQENTKNPNLAGAEMIDGPLVRAEVTFVLELAVVAGARARPGDIESVLSTLRRKLLSFRYAGGTLHPTKAGAELVTGPHSGKELTDALRALPPGFLLKDRSDYLAARAKDVPDTLDVLIELSSLKKGEAKRWERAVPGALTPISVGYRAIELPKARRTLRRASDAPLHVYAESLASVGEWVHLSRLVRAGGSLDGFLWRPHHNVASGIYYGSATGPVTSGSA